MTAASNMLIAGMLVTTRLTSDKVAAAPVPLVASYGCAMNTEYSTLYRPLYDDADEWGERNPDEYESLILMIQVILPWPFEYHKHSEPRLARSKPFSPMYDVTTRVVDLIARVTHAPGYLRWFEGRSAERLVRRVQGSSGLPSTPLQSHRGLGSADSSLHTTSATRITSELAE